jgi:hypothetical protein
MRYLLVVGFACDIYKKEPQARIFLNNRLLDEFQILYYKDTLGTTMKKFWENTHVLQPVLLNEIHALQKKNFPPLRFYEIDIDNNLDQIELRVEIKNSDNNYTNGFMTSSTLLKLQLCYFFPLNQKLLLRLVKFRKKNFVNKNYAWYASNQNIIFKLSDNGIQWHNNEKEIKIFSLKDSVSNIGGDGYFSCTLVKKYGIFISKLIQPYRYNLFGTPIIDYLIDKYKQHANQRSIN